MVNYAHISWSNYSLMTWKKFVNNVKIHGLIILIESHISNIYKKKEAARSNWLEYTSNNGVLH